MAVNRYFDRTLMPYNPIERPMPFDQLMQAGLMKQQALDRTNAAISEFQEQKMLTGGARTNDAAQQLNQEYGGKASALTDRIMSGEITPDQASYELRNINKAYNTDAAVKQVLMDQSLMNVSNQAIVNERLRAGRAENPYYDYDSQTFRQAKLEDLKSGKDVIGADNYALLTDPGLFEDFKGMLAQVHEEYFKNQGLDVYFDQGTMQYKEKSSNNVVGIDSDRLKQMITQYVTAAPIEDSDMQSVQYRLAKAGREGNEYAEQNLIDELMQVTAFKPWMSYQKTEDLSGLGSGKNKGRTGTDEEEPLPIVRTELGAEESGLQNVRTAMYGINQDNPVEGIREILKSDESRLSAANRRIGVKNYKLKPGSTLDAPEFTYSDGSELAPEDLNDARAEFQQYKNDINFFEGVERMADERFRKQSGFGISKFFERSYNKHKESIDARVLQKASAIDPGPGFTEERAAALAVDLAEDLGLEEPASINKYNTTLTVQEVFGESMPEGLDLGEKKTWLANKLIENGIDKEVATRYANQRQMAKQNYILENIPLNLVGSFTTLKGNAVKATLDKHYGKEATLDVLGQKDRVAFEQYKSIDDSVQKILEDNNKYKLGLGLNTLEGKDGRRAHRILEEAVLNNETLTLRRTEGKPGSGEKAGGTLRDVYAAMGGNASAKDFKPIAVYLNEGPDGNVQMYARMQWRPASGTKDFANIDELEVAGQKGSWRDFDVNITQYLNDFFTQDVTMVYHAAALMQDQVYTMDINETRSVYIPSKYGPAATVNVKRVNTGVMLDGFVYGEDPNGNVVKENVMDHYYKTTGAPAGTAIPLKEAAEFAGQVASSAAGVAIKHPDMFDKDGNYLGADIPSKVLDRASQVESTLETNIDALRTAMPNIDPDESNQEVIDQLKKIIGFETAGQYHPNTRNTGKTDDPAGEKATAVGLIQFYEDAGKDQIKTIAKKEYTFAELGRMSIPQQITDVVIPYLAENGSKVKTIDELYFAIFMPAFVGMDKNLTLEDAVAQAESSGINMKGLQPGDIKASNKAFNQARTLRDVLDIVENYRKF
jgi:hypothetical protein